MSDRKDLFMDMYQMNRQGVRPYNHTCGMNRPQQVQANRERAIDVRPSSQDCGCHMPGTTSVDAEMYTHLQHLIPAMAYVPCQEFTTTFDLEYALEVGTIFPQLCKPFCGKGGGCK
jgi:hypothetical protein